MNIDRKETQDKIFRLLKKIHNIHKQYNPHATFLDITINCDNDSDYYYFRNFDDTDDEQYPIRFTYLKSKNKKTYLLEEE